MLIEPAKPRKHLSPVDDFPISMDHAAAAHRAGKEA
jgi:hypothetical protein